MSMSDRLTGDEPLVPQVDMGPRLGGFKTVLNRLQGYIGVISRGMIAAMFYQNLELWAFSPTIPGVGVEVPIGPTLLPNMIIYLVWCALGAAALGAFDIRYVLGSEKRFHNLAAERAERSPLKSDTEQILDRLDRLEQSMTATDGGQTEDDNE